LLVGHEEAKRVVLFAGVGAIVVVAVSLLLRTKRKR
jgi:hypothetical protein